MKSTRLTFENDFLFYFRPVKIGLSKKKATKLSPEDGAKIKQNKDVFYCIASRKRLIELLKYNRATSFALSYRLHSCTF